MVNADVTLTYRHQGYQRLEGLNVVRRTIDAQSREERWLTEIMAVINEVRRLHLYLNAAM